MTQAITFHNAHFGTLNLHIRSAAARGLPCVDKDRHADAPGALLLSTGNSIKNKTVLRQVKKFYKEGFVVMALKETVPYLWKKGIRATYSAAMDPGAERQIARTPVQKEVTYCLASSCNPALFDHVLAAGARVEVYHSACGARDPRFARGIQVDLSAEQGAVIEGEFDLQTTDGLAFSPVVSWFMSETDLYKELFPVADVMCGGFTVTNRALALLKYMGFGRVVMAGTDFGWREGGTNGHYCDLVRVGVTEDGTEMYDQGQVDGKDWYTRPDQLASAVDVAKKVKAGEIEVLGDSLAAALAKRDDEFVEKICTVK